MYIKIYIDVCIYIICVFVCNVFFFGVQGEARQTLWDELRAFLGPDDDTAGGDVAAEAEAETKE